MHKHQGDPDEDTAVPDRLDWLDRTKFKWYKPLGKTAQCHPYLFTTSLARLAQDGGVKFVTGTVDSLVYSENGKEVRAVTYHDAQSHDNQLSATDVILAAGPWTQRLLPQAPIRGEKSHSVVVEPQRDISPTIIFFDPGHIVTGDEYNQLEIYPRPDGTVYMSGQTDYGLELPQSTDDVDVDLARCQELMDNVAIVSPDLAPSRVRIKQACFRPIVDVEGRDPELGPLLGLTGIEGLLLAAGHNQWGIQNSPITGKVISELVFQGKAVSADIGRLDPRIHLDISGTPRS